MESSRQEYWSGLPFPSPKGEKDDLKGNGEQALGEREVVTS